MIGNCTIDGGKMSGKMLMGTLHAEIQGQPMDFRMESMVDGDKMTGTFTNPTFGAVPFTASRAK